VHAEAVLLVDDGQGQVRNTTASCISAWVPTTTCASPLATCSITLARALPVTLPASQAMRTPSGSSQRAGC
jgi:hypothetical protein